MNIPIRELSHKIMKGTNPINIQKRTVPYGEVMREIRTIRGIKQKEVANHLGISQNTYSKMETGNTIITRSRLLKVSEFLNFNIDIVDSVASEYFNTIVSDKEYEKEQHELYEKLGVLVKAYESQEDIVKFLKDKIEYLEKTVAAQEETIKLLKKK